MERTAESALLSLSMSSQEMLARMGLDEEDEDLASAEPDEVRRWGRLLSLTEREHVRLRHKERRAKLWELMMEEAHEDDVPRAPRSSPQIEFTQPWLRAERGSRDDKLRSKHRRYRTTRCLYPGCLQGATLGECCRTHKCSESMCLSVRAEGSLLCLRHTREREAEMQRADS